MNNLQEVKESAFSDQQVPLKEKLSYALTNTGQTMIYGIITTYLLMFMTDYLHILSSVAGVIIGAARVFDAINDPIMGQIVDKTKTKWGKCRPYMLFTPIPVAIFTLLLFAPFKLDKTAVTIYAAIIYILFTMIYTANDIPYWSMSSVITKDPKERVKIVTMTRIIGGLGSGLTIGAFWTVFKFINEGGVSDKRMSFFLSALVFCVIGTALMLQGFFKTKERSKITSQSEKFFDNLKLIRKSRALVINIIAGMLFSITTVGVTALTTYFVKWNIKEIFSDMSSNTVMSIFTPVIGILPAISTLAGLLAVPVLVKRYEKRDILVVSCVIGIVANIIFYFVGYSNIYLFIIGRFIAFFPMGIWISITTLMIGDSVDEIDVKTNKRIEGTCFSILTFMGKFQNGLSIAIAGMILSFIKYNGELDPDAAQQLPETLKGIFFMVTIVTAIGLFISLIPFLFYNLNNEKHGQILAQLQERKEVAGNEQ
ncbi:MAG: MFS transporter [Christensenellales bacterium]|jgi:sugar (glycoside-pentoside-hexuronide) transporter